MVNEEEVLVRSAPKLYHTVYESNPNLWSFCFFLLSLSLLGISPMKSMFMWEVAAGASTYVENVASAVRSRACWKSTSERTPMSVRTFANTATLPSKPKVRGQFTSHLKHNLYCCSFHYIITIYFMPSCWKILIFLALCKSRATLMCFSCSFLGNLTKHMKSKAHGKKCQAMGVSESSLDEPESEETGT